MELWNWLVMNFKGYLTISLMIMAILAAFGLGRSVAKSVEMVWKDRREK